MTDDPKLINRGKIVFQMIKKLKIIVLESTFLKVIRNKMCTSKLDGF